MPKLRLIQPGFEHMTGLLGNIDFEDGVSVESVSRRDADRLGAIFKVVDADTNEECNAAKSINQKLRPVEAKVTETDANTTSEEETKPEPTTETAEPVSEPVEAEPEPEPESDVKIYSEAELHVIADEKGIAGLREIAGPMGLKDNRIVDLIQKILIHQAAK